MPKIMEQHLKAIARKRGYGKKRAGAYTYGTLKKIESASQRKGNRPGKYMSNLYKGKG